MSQDSDKREGAPPEDGEGRAEAHDGAADAGEQLAPSLTSELMSLNAMLTEALDLLVRERRTMVFKPPIATPPAIGMATDGQVDSFRELRTRLVMKASAAGLTHFTTMVVPVTEGSGGSFVARNLAAAFTLQQRLTVLVDCNFRNATQHEMLGASDGEEGLFEFLGHLGEVPLERLIRPTPLPGLHVIPAGRVDSVRAGPPREHFSSPPLKALLARLREEPCDVFLDGPPVEGSPDARILSELADLVVLVVGYGRTTTRAIERAAKVFDEKKFAGVVFNEFGGVGAAGRAAAARR